VGYKKKKILNQNERGNCQEFVMHGSNLAGVVEVLKRNKDREKKNINHTSIHISWVTESDKVTSINDIMPPRDRGWACGATSGYAAVHYEKPDELFMIGHDLESLAGKINNVYKGSLHYGLPEAGPIPSSNWITQWKSLFEQNPKVTFYKVNQHNKGIDRVNTRVHEWNNIKNIKYINYDDLKSALTK
jgi:hypothetical protein